MNLNITRKFNICKKIALLVLCIGFQQSYAQNSCATALPVTVGTYTVGTIDGSLSFPSCADGSNAEWYVYTPTANHSVTVSSDLPINICKDTNFNVYTGTCGSLACYTEDDDSGDLNCNSGNTFSYLSKKTFDAMVGTTYYIAWDNKWSDTGFSFQLSEAPFVPSPCSTATVLTAGTTTVNAVNGTNVSTDCSTASLAKWYAYTPTSNYRVTVSSDLAANICKNTNFSVYTGSCSGGLECVTSDDNSGNIACNSGNTNSNLSKRTFDVDPGVTYFIVWDNKWSADGFTFELTEEVIVYPVTYTAQSFATINSDWNMCLVDMNGDNKDDIVGVDTNNLRIHYQGVAGALTVNDYAVPGANFIPDWSIAAGDYNKDGYNDLMTGNSDGVTFWKSNGSGTGYSSTTPGEYIFCQRTNFADLDNDGNLDAFSCHDIAPNVYYLNDGSGNFTHYQSSIDAGAMAFGSVGGNYASIWTDYDNDGDSDLFISKCSGPPCELHRNDGNGVYTDVSALAQINVTPISSWSSAVADFDNDGDMDILIGSNGGVATKLFRNDVNTSNSVEEPFVNITAGSGWDTDGTMNRDYICYDFDNDGFLDVMGSGERIMFNQGDGTFEVSNYSNLFVGAVGDMNSDGFLDILNGNTVHYAVPNGNKWIRISLKGIQSNSNGIGARVEVYGPFGKKIRDVRSGEGFEFMSTLNAHFGLGDATEVDKVIIRWPSGIVDTILDPTINQSLTVVEGSAVLAVDEMNSNNFRIYPNPADDVLNIALGTSLSALKSVAIYDLNGRFVSNATVTNDAISVKSLSTGTYLLLLKTTDGKQFTQKFLKK